MIQPFVIKNIIPSLETMKVTNHFPSVLRQYNN